MSNPVAEASPPRPRRWRGLLLALVLFLFAPAAQLRVLVPVEQTALLLVPIIAVCALTTWIAGGKWWIAAAWAILAAWFLLIPAGPAGMPYDKMARGWALLIAGCFGLMSVWNAASPFMTRAVGALGLAMGAGLLLALFSPGGMDRFQHSAAAELVRRSNETIALTNTPEWRSMVARSSLMKDATAGVETQMAALTPFSAMMFPALLALESLIGMALGWAVYHRLSTEPAGPPLAPFREFRFNDQLIWGLAVGGTLMLPAFLPARNVGWNLLLFFGALYFLRGVSVMLWMSRPQAMMLLGFMALILLFYPPLVLMLLALPLAMGLSDTWLDWRRRLAAK